MRPVRPAAFAVLVALGLGACGSDIVQGAEPTDGPTAGAPAWQALPAAPLSPRTTPVAAWTGTEALFLGGETGEVCPPNADCMKGPDLARDGAAYNPATGTWRKVADAPVALGGPLRPAVIGDE